MRGITSVESFTCLQPTNIAGAVRVLCCFKYKVSKGLDGSGYITPKYQAKLPYIQRINKNKTSNNYKNDLQKTKNIKTRVWGFVLETPYITHTLKA